MKLHNVTKCLIGLFFAYFIVFAYSYGEFLHIPIFASEVITWKSVLEQLTSWIAPVVAYLFLFLTITKNKLKKSAIFSRKSQFLVAGVFILIFLLAFSLGVHAMAQMVEDFIIVDNSAALFKLVWFFDEYVGHTFLIFLSGLLSLLAYFELNTQPQKTSFVDLRITETTGILNGSLWGVSGVEGGSMYILLPPITLLASYILIIKIIREKVNLKEYLFTRCFLVSVLALTIFTGIWIVNSSVFAQPSDFGFVLFSI